MIYLDHAATTPTDKRVIKTMKPYFDIKYGNPSSQHQLGQQAKNSLNQARQELCTILNCQPEELIFTSGGSESNNQVIASFKHKHIISTTIEHHSIEEALKKVKDHTLVKPDKTGLVKPESVRKAIKHETGLVSIIYGNNELGVIQPIREIGKMIKKINEKRADENQIFFHTDAVQAIEYLKIDVKYLHVDLLSLSAHKFYGPKGIGALFSSKKVLLSSIIKGGEQEYGHRAGTENMPGIIGLGKAIKILKTEKAKQKKSISKLRQYFEKQITKEIDNTIVNCLDSTRLPHISSIIFNGAEGESILLALDLKGIAVSTGSACASYSHTPSHVLTAIGLTPEQAQSTVRFSFGKANTRTEINKVIIELKKTISHLRKISPKLNY